MTMKMHTGHNKWETTTKPKNSDDVLQLCQDIERTMQGFARPTITTLTMTQVQTNVPLTERTAFLAADRYEIKWGVHEPTNTLWIRGYQGQPFAVAVCELMGQAANYCHTCNRCTPGVAYHGGLQRFGRSLYAPKLAIACKQESPLRSSFVLEFEHHHTGQDGPSQAVADYFSSPTVQCVVFVKVYAATHQYETLRTMQIGAVMFTRAKGETSVHVSAAYDLGSEPLSNARKATFAASAACHETDHVWIRKPLHLHSEDADPIVTFPDGSPTMNVPFKLLVGGRVGEDKPEDFVIDLGLGIQEFCYCVAHYSKDLFDEKSE